MDYLADPFFAMRFVDHFPDDLHWTFLENSGKVIVFENIAGRVGDELPVGEGELLVLGGALQ